MGGGGGPRQKMVNMMYLVLTALLAMNVSKDILRSFQTLANSLEVTGNQFSKNNTELAKMIKEAVAEEVKKGKKKNEALPAKIDEVTKKCDEIVAAIEKDIKFIYTEECAGTDVLTGGLAANDEKEKTYRYFMMSAAGDDHANGGRGAGMAKRMKEDLNGLITWANKKYEEYTTVYDPDGKKIKHAGIKDHFKPLCVEPKDDPTVKKADDKGFTWEYLTFHETPAVAVLAILQKFKADVRTTEAAVLEALKSQLSEVPLFKFDQYSLQVAPISSSVVAGQPFEADLFLIQSTKDAKFKASYSGKGVETKKDKPGEPEYGHLKLNTSLGDMPDGKNEMDVTYSAEASIKDQDGKPINVKFKEPKRFKVLRPIIKVASASVNNMYKDCANDIEVDVPALGSLYNPSFAAENGATMAIPGKANKFVRCIPNTKNEFILKVSNKSDAGTSYIGKEKWNVIPPPKPIVKFLVDGKDYVPNAQYKYKAKFEVVVEADKEFAKALPDDARYIIGSINIRYRQGMVWDPASKPMPKSSASSKPKSDVKLTEVTPVPSGRPMDVEVQVETINRYNFEKKQLDENIQKSTLTYIFSVNN